MPSKLTLSVPAKTVAKAKRFAKRRGTSVSALFTEVIESIPDEDEAVDALTGEWPEMASFVGIAEDAAPYDERSRSILEKHG